MKEINLFAIFIERIEKTGINYFIGGSVASIVYGEPRLTHDIDLIIHLHLYQIDKLIANFPDDVFYLPPKEVIESELQRGRKGHFNIIHHDTGFKADIYFVGEDSLQQWALESSTKIDFHNLKLPIAPPEYIIVQKLLFYKEGKAYKHLDDIKGIVKQSSKLINEELLNNLLNEYDVKGIYDSIT